MSWLKRPKGKHEPGSTEPTSVEGPSPIVTAEFPRFDSGGRPIVEFTPEARTMMRLDGVRSDFADIYRKQFAVRICIDFLADNIAHCRLKVYRKQADGSRVEEPGHPLAKLLDKPQPGVSGFDFIRDTVADSAIFGNGHWVLRRAGDSKALVRVMAPFVTGKGGSPVGGPKEYIVDVGGGPVPVRTEDMIHFRQYNPSDIRVGTSVLEALQSVLSEEAAVSRHRRHYWDNAARQEGWIKRPKGAGRWNRTQRREFREDWQAAHSGPNNAGKTAILEDDMELHPYSFSPRDSEFIEGRNWGLDVVATAFHIPLAALSRGGSQTFASMKEFHTMVYVDTLGPWMAMMEKTINVQLVPIFRDPDIFVEFNIEEKLQGDFESQALAMRSAGHVPYMSVNDLRAIRNMKPIGNPNDPNNPFNTPAQPANYNYGLHVAPPITRADTPTQTTEQDQAALDELFREQAALDAALEEGSTNGHVRV